MPRVVTPGGIVSDCSLFTPSKVLLPIVVRPLPRVSVSISSQPAKAASDEMVVTEFGITRVTSLFPRKAELPIVTSPSLSVREVKFTFANALAPIVVTLPGITSVVIA